MPQSSPGRNRDEDPPNPHLVETVAKSSYDQRRVGTVTRIHLILTWSRPWQRVPMINAGSQSSEFSNFKDEMRKQMLDFMMDIQQLVRPSQPPPPEPPKPSPPLETKANLLWAEETRDNGVVA
ncbi:hypothetical protein ACLKA7_000821 [Drosophila subpalustris]